MYKPIILDYYDYDKTKHDKYLTEKKVYFKLNCKYCSKEISAAIDITSNWVSHIKAKHKDTFLEYEKRKNESNKTTVDAAKSIKARYFSKPGKFKYSDSQQKKLDLLLVKLVVNASLPLYLVDQQDFRNFVAALNPQYRLAYKKR